MFDYTGDNMTLTDPISFPIDLIQGYAYHLLFTLVYTRVSPWVYTFVDFHYSWTHARTLELRLAFPSPSLKLTATATYIPLTTNSDNPTAPKYMRGKIFASLVEVGAKKEAMNRS